MREGSRFEETEEEHKRELHFKVSLSIKSDLPDISNINNFVQFHKLC